MANERLIKFAFLVEWLINFMVGLFSKGSSTEMLIMNKLKT